MNIISVLILVGTLLGVLIGVSGTWGWRFLSRLGTTRILSIDPHGDTYAESWVRRSGPLWAHKHGDREGLVPMSEARVLSPDKEAALGVAADGSLAPAERARLKVLTRGGSNQKLVVVDGAAMVPVTIDPDHSRAVHPNGERLRQIARTTAYREINEEEQGMNIKTLVIAALVVVAILGVLTVILLSKVSKIAAGMGGA